MRLFATLVATLSLASSALPAFAKTDPGEPLLGSFIEDFSYARGRLAQHVQGAELAIVCDYEPCTLREDFDGDGDRDLSFQVVRSTGQAAGSLGIAIALTGGGFFVYGAGLDTSGLEAAIATARTQPTPWVSLSSAGLTAPPITFGAAVHLHDTLLYWSGSTFVVQSGLQRRNGL